MLRIADITDFDKISKVLSMDDLATLLALPNMLAGLNKDKQSSFNSLWLHSIHNYWSKTANNTTKYYETLDKVISPLSAKESLKEEIIERFKVNEVNKSDTLYTVIDAERDLIVLVIYPGFLSALDRPRFQYGLFKRLLKLFYVYLGPAGSFQQCLFGDYVKLLNTLDTAQQGSL